MNVTDIEKSSLLYGNSELSNIVSVEVNPNDATGTEVVLFIREGNTIRTQSDSFRPFAFIASEYIDRCPVKVQVEKLNGQAPLDCLVSCKSWGDFSQLRKWVQSESGESPSSPSAPYLAYNDPITQYLMRKGVTLFRGMSFGDLNRMQFDIECITTPGFSFCNAKREGDRIVTIGVSDSSGWEMVIGGPDHDEADILDQFFEVIRERDPDVLEGHNIFNFDLPYIAERALRYDLKMRIGRDGSEPRQRSSQLSMAERTVSYTRYDVYGRQLIDTYFLVQAYDMIHRNLDSYSLKNVARHFGVASDERTYIDGGDITAVFHENPERLMAYLLDDVHETRAISALLSPSIFMQAQMLPLSYQNTSIRGNASKIDLLLVREYLHRKASLPKPAGGRPISGGYTDLFEEGVLKPVHHCDIRSLYPSLMMTHGFGPSSDTEGVFLEMLGTLRDFRLKAKAAMREAKDDSLIHELDALQSAFKILINSFYGYLGFQQARFNDFEVADKITSEGRQVLNDMVFWLQSHDAKPIEIDTDGIYFVPPPNALAGDAKDAFRSAMAAALPDGLEVEFDGEYKAMYSYKMKNYALLRDNGEVLVKGAALKSRGLERFQREFLQEFLRMKLDGRDSELPKLKSRYDEMLKWRKFPVEFIAKSETLSDSLAVYQRKRDQEGGARRAPYELALGSDIKFKPGDQVAYYVTGTKKNVAVHEHAKLVSDWDPEKRDENIAYYQSKLDSLYEKFGGPPPAPAQGELF